MAQWLQLGIFLSHRGTHCCARRGPVRFFLALLVAERDRPAVKPALRKPTKYRAASREESRPAPSLLPTAKRRLLPRRAESIIGP